MNNQKAACKKENAAAIRKGMGFEFRPQHIRDGKQRKPEKDNQQHNFHRGNLLTQPGKGLKQSGYPVGHIHHSKRWQG